jgi:hypothetical protein
MEQAISRFIVTVEGKLQITPDGIIILAVVKMDEKLQTFWHTFCPSGDCTTSLKYENIVRSVTNRFEAII